MHQYTFYCLKLSAFYFSWCSILCQKCFHVGCLSHTHCTSGSLSVFLKWKEEEDVMIVQFPVPHTHTTELGCHLLFVAKCSDWFHNDKVTSPSGWEQILTRGYAKITTTGLINFIRTSLGLFPCRHWLKFIAHKFVGLFSLVEGGAEMALLSNIRL